MPTQQKLQVSGIDDAGDEHIFRTVDEYRAKEMFRSMREQFSAVEWAIVTIEEEYEEDTAEEPPDAPPRLDTLPDTGVYCFACGEQVPFGTGSYTPVLGHLCPMCGGAVFAD